MADYTVWDVNALLPGEPWTSAKAIAAFENLNAAFEGAPDAPRLYLRALEPLTAGDSIRSRNDATVTASASTPLTTVTLHSFGFIQYGTVRARAEKTTAAGSLQLLRIRNGVATQLLSTTSTAVQTVDAAVIPGDVLSWALTGPQTTGSAQARNARFSTGIQDLWPGPVDIRVEGNRNAL